MSSDVSPQQPQAASSSSKLTRVFSRTPSSWDPQDDLLLRHLKEQQKLGWKEIASHFAHRTPNACQFRWRRLRSGSLKSSSSTSTSSSPAASSTSSASSSTTSKRTTSTTIAAAATANTTASAAAAAAAAAEAATLASSTSSSTSIATSAINTSSMSRGSPESPSSTNPSSHAFIQTSFKRSSVPLAPTYKNWSFQSHESQETTGIDSEHAHLDPLTRSFEASSPSDESAIREEWTNDEDELLLARRQRELSFTELSILLPYRSEGEIKDRIDQLDKKTTTTTTTSSTSPLNDEIETETETPIKAMHSFQRSYSNSSQNSTYSSSPSSNYFLNKDFTTRSKSFSYFTSPSIFSNINPTSISDRYNQTLNRKNSIFSITDTIPKNSRSNSMNEFKKMKINSKHDSDNDDDETETKLPPLGSIFNDYFTK